MIFHSIQHCAHLSWKYGHFWGEGVGEEDLHIISWKKKMTSKNVNKIPGCIFEDSKGKKIDRKNDRIYIRFILLSGKYLRLFSWYYECAKWMKFLVAVIYGLPRWHSNSSKTLKKTEKMEIIFSPSRYTGYEGTKWMKFL